MTTPNRIVLISTGKYEEYVAGADIYPGQIGQINSSGQLIPHAVPGGAGPLRVVQEDVLNAGKTTADKISSGSIAPTRMPNKGDTLLFKVAPYAPAIIIGSSLISAGDGNLTLTPGTVMANIVAASTTITNTGTETAFSNGSLTIAANTFQVGDVLKVRAKAFCLAENSTNTHRVRLYINSTTLADSAAIQLAANDFVRIDLALTIRTIGASGTFIADGILTTDVSGTITTTTFTVASTALDTTAAATLVIKSLASATSTGNQIRLDEFNVRLERNGGLNVLVEAKEAVDNSAVATASFIRGVVQ